MKNLKVLFVAAFMICSGVLNGQVSTSFNPSYTSTVVKAMLQDNYGRLYVAGYEDGSFTVPFFHRLFSDGSIDTSFHNPYPGSAVINIDTTITGNLIVVGIFDVSGHMRNKFYEASSVDGSVVYDTINAYNPINGFDVITTTCNFFQTDLPGLTIDVFLYSYRNEIKGINYNGFYGLGPPVYFSPAGNITFIKRLDNKIFTGFFKGISKHTASGSTGSITVNMNADDIAFCNNFYNTFDTSGVLNCEVRSIDFLPDSSIILGGLFYKNNSQGSHDTMYVVKLHPDGTFDSTFQASYSVRNYVHTVQVCFGDKIFVGGTFISSFFDFSGNYVSNFIIGQTQALVSSSIDEYSLFVGGNFTNFDGFSVDNLVKLEGVVPLIDNTNEFVIDHNALTLYPMPVEGVLQIRSENQMVECKLLDSKGGTVYYGKTDHIDMTNLSPGIYYLQAIFDKNILIKKVIKQ